MEKIEKVTTILDLYIWSRRSGNPGRYQPRGWYDQPNTKERAKAIQAFAEWAETKTVHYSLRSLSEWGSRLLLQKHSDIYFPPDWNDRPHYGSMRLQANDNGGFTANMFVEIAKEVTYLSSFSSDKERCQYLEKINLHRIAWQKFKEAMLTGRVDIMRNKRVLIETPKKLEELITSFICREKDYIYPFIVRARNDFNLAMKIVEKMGFTRGDVRSALKHGLCEAGIRSIKEFVSAFDKAEQEGE